MAFKFQIGDDVITKTKLKSDNGPVNAGTEGMVDDAHPSAGNNIYIVRFINLSGPDSLAPAFENQLDAAP